MEASPSRVHVGQREAGAGLCCDPHETHAAGASVYQRVEHCRSCSSRNLTEVLDFGEPCISDFVRPGEQGQAAPLSVVRCEECSLVQTRHTIAPERLFSRYHYRSGTNETMRAALRDVVRDACERVHLEPGDEVLDIGANDGTLLRAYPEYVIKHGYEPALNVVPEGVYEHRGRFFPGPAVRLSHWQGRYKIITSIAMFYAVDHPHGFVDAIKHLLAKDGVWVVQFQDLASILRDRAFDYFVHEHLCLYSRHSFERLIRPHGLEIRDWSTNDVNGGSLRIVVGHGSGRCFESPAIEDGAGEWASFGEDVQHLRRETVALLTKLKDAGKRVGALAASTKANTLLQFYGIGPELLPWIAERQPEKVGLVTVGSGIPIMSEEWARAQRPEYLVTLAWHFLDSFQRREVDFVNRGGVFIQPLPELALISRAPVAAAA